jgi:hypothetical protein
MARLTKFQAVRTALQDLGPGASNEEIRAYVAKEFGIDFPDPNALALYISMVNSKMTRKGVASKMPSSERK